MKKRTRFTILLTCIACFLVVSPVLVFYSMGYRLDLEKMKITLTGGIYVRTFPTADKITFDSKTSEKPAIFSNSVFKQSLLPNPHTVLVEKNGYYDYYKTVTVQEKQVTKLENILLFKKNIQFVTITDQAQSPFNNKDKFLIKNNNLYYSNIIENNILTATQRATPVLQKIIAYDFQNNNIVWLGTNGFLYKSDLTNLSTEPVKITPTPLKINRTGIYKIISNNNNIFINNNGNLLVLDNKKGELNDFYSPITDAKISPDGKNIVFYKDNAIYLSPTGLTLEEKYSLYKSPDKINNLVWLNNSYIIFTSGNKITISEIDYRGNINSITLPQVMTLQDNEEIIIKNPQIFFNPQENNLYVLTDKTLLVSEKLVP